MDSLNISEAIFSKATIENATLRLGVFTVLIGAAGALIAFGLWRKIRNRRRGHRVLKRSTSLALLHGGEMALQRLVEYHEARVDSHKLDEAECDLKAWIHDERRPDFRKLARIIAKLEMSGKEDIAIRMLEGEIKKAHKDEKIHEEYEFEMLLVEMLIFKGEFKKALDHKCLKDQTISDARRPLYKAIIFLMTSQREKAKEVWQEFSELKASFSCQPAMKESMEETGIYKLCSNFEEFEKIVIKLKADIERAKKIIPID